MLLAIESYKAYYWLQVATLVIIVIDCYLLDIMVSHARQNLVWSYVRTACYVRPIKARNTKMAYIVRIYYHMMFSVNRIRI